MRGNSKTNAAMALIARKQRIGQADADEIALPLLVCLDAAKRGQAPHAHANTLSQHVLAAVILWAKQDKKALYAEACAAWQAMVKACARPTQLLDLTTGEYQAIRKALAHYLKALPLLEVGTLAAVTALAVETMNKDRAA